MKERKIQIQAFQILFLEDNTPIDTFQIQMQ